jgi:hypothetical protein
MSNIELTVNDVTSVEIEPESLISNETCAWRRIVIHAGDRKVVLSLFSKFVSKDGDIEPTFPITL